MVKSSRDTIDEGPEFLILFKEADYKYCGYHVVTGEAKTGRSRQDVTIWYDKAEASRRMKRAGIRENLWARQTNWKTAALQSHWLRRRWGNG